MKAVVVHAADDLRIDELPHPTPAPDEVVVAMEWGGLCGSDISYWRHGASGTAVLKRPLVLGHEVAGSLFACLKLAPPSHQDVAPDARGFHAERTQIGSRFGSLHRRRRQEERWRRRRSTCARPP